ncbi:uncharacterized protein LACBIDRAFT_331520 [Laccaria bicolor S238N-H82]|uniref:Predicted protein n=1 Tax=Laccaria bicolor (strain S238N-H82 / ATCC MYA-4686) TaxID=486041 RepID=B0DPQ6_LACBS|nr:uncharacterized protein LACBIDRAFT_331520 [Laccaria bicolor S238N-H82]EDR03420.1 predicted protein [Laccaria bicolor S238N-H82]|eukprot:XP_001885876.1 predicted protein [Laccaria bicolor S238N-H82]
MYGTTTNPFARTSCHCRSLNIGDTNHLTPSLHHGQRPKDAHCNLSIAAGLVHRHARSVMKITLPNTTKQIFEKSVVQSIMQMTVNQGGAGLGIPYQDPVICLTLVSHILCITPLRQSHLPLMRRALPSVVAVYPHQILICKQGVRDTLVPSKMCGTCASTPEFCLHDLYKTQGNHSQMMSYYYIWCCTILGPIS